MSFWTRVLAIGLCIAPLSMARADQCTKSQCIDRKTFYDGFREFNKRTPVTQDRNRITLRAFEALQSILDRWDTTEEYQDTRWLAYIVATAFWETGGHLYPVREGLCRDDACSREYLEELWRQRRVTFRYWDPDPLTGQSYYGRGLVQLTFRTNYQRVGDKLEDNEPANATFLALGKRLVDQPDLALKARISSAALVEGMVQGWYNDRDEFRGLGFYLRPGTEDTRAYQEARRTVNLQDQAAAIAKFADTIHGFIRTVPAGGQAEMSRGSATRASSVDGGRPDPINRDEVVGPRFADGGVGEEMVRARGDVGTAVDDAFRDLPVDMEHPVGPRLVNGIEEVPLEQVELSKKELRKQRREQRRAERDAKREARREARRND